MRRASRALALALLPLVALVAVGCTSGNDTVEAATPEPFVPVSTAVETEAGLLLVDWDSVAPALSSARLLDGRTLEDLGGAVPMQRSGPVDPSGRWIAVPDPARGWSQPANVFVYDIETWELAWQVDDLPYGTLSWDAGGLLWWGDHCPSPQGEGVCGEPWVRGVWRLTPEGAKELVRFDFAPYPAPGIGESGDRAYVIGIETQFSSGIDPAGDAFLAVLDLRAGTVDAKIPLPNLLVGQPGHWLGSTDHLFGGVYRPAAVLSADETRMYIAHAEADRITVVDLDEQRVTETHSLQEGSSPVSRLGGWLLDLFTRTADAKMAAEYLRQAQLTPDGRYLLMSGSAVAEKPSEVATDEFVETAPRGLLVVDLTTMDVVH